MFYSERGLMTAFQSLLKDKIYKKVFSDAYNAIYAECDAETQQLLDVCYEADGDYYEYIGEPSDDEIVKNIMWSRYANWWFGYPEDNTPIIFSIQFISYKDNSENERIESYIDLHLFAERGNYLEGLWLAKLVKSVAVHESDDNHIFSGIYVHRLESFGNMSMSPDSSYFVQVNNGSYYPFKITYDTIYGGS
jgi:hypothetical protein